MKPKTPTSTPVMNTLTECSNKLYSQGFIENYKIMAWSNRDNKTVQADIAIGEFIKLVAAIDKNTTREENL